MFFKLVNVTNYDCCHVQKEKMFKRLEVSEISQTLYDNMPPFRVEDFHYLRDNLTVDFGGKICISRYGQIFR
jgi:hypothetical protein